MLTWNQVVLGNKIDLEENKRMISSKRAMAFCGSKGGIPYFETSAKEAVNIESAFEGMSGPTFEQLNETCLVDSIPPSSHR